VQKFDGANTEQDEEHGFEELEDSNSHKPAIAE
jgi:hypothetical protein